MRDLVHAALNAFHNLAVAVSNQRDAAAHATMAFAKIRTLSDLVADEGRLDQIRTIADDAMAALSNVDIIASREVDDLTVKVQVATHTALHEANYEIHSLSDPKVREQVWALTDGKCAYCDCALGTKDSSLATFVIEHVIPRHSGGPDHLTNYVPSCVGCNSAKGREHVLLFVKRHVARRVANVMAANAAMAPMSEAAE